MADNLDVKININADGNGAEQELKKTSAGLNETAASADAASFSFLNLAKSSLSVVTNLALLVINLARLSANYVGLTVNVETTNTRLKIFDFLVQNTRKEITLSLGFLKTFADFLRNLSFPITPLIKFIDLMGDFRIKIGIGKGDKTLFEQTEEGIKKAAVAVKNFNLSQLRDDIKSAAVSLGLFAAQTAVTFKSLKEGIARESAFSQAARTINGTKEELQGLKTQIETLSSTKLAVPVEQLYEVAGVAGAMGMSLKDIPNFMQLVSEAAVALDIPASDLAEKFGTIKTQLDLDAESMRSFGDQVNAVADSLPGKVKEVDIFEVLAMGVATAGKNFGLLKGETVALAGSLLSLGEAPETARTGLINLLSSLQNAKNQTPDFQKGLALMGTSAEKLAADIKDKPLPALVSLLEKMHGLSNAEQLDIATKFLGKGQDANALAKLVDNTDLLKEALKKATDETQYSGSIHDAYAQQIQTVDAKLTLLKNSYNNVKESLTSTFLPAINLVVDSFVNLSNALGKFSDNHPIFKTFAAVAVSILSMAGALRALQLGITLLGRLFGFTAQGGILASVLSKFRIAFVAAAGAWASFNLIGIAGIVTAIRAGTIFSALRAVLIAVFGGTIGLAIGAIGLLFTAISNLLPMTVKWGDTTATIGEVISAAWGVITDYIGESFAKISEWINSFSFVKVIKELDIFKEAWNFENFFQSIIDSTNNFANKVIGSFMAVAAAMQNIGSKGYVDRIKIAFNKDYIGEFGKDNFAKDTIEEKLKQNQAKKEVAKKDQRASDNQGSLPPEKSDDVIAAEKKQADLIAQIKKEQRAKEIQDLRDQQAESIRLIENSGESQKTIDEQIFITKMNSLSAIGQAIKNQYTAEQIDLRAHTAAKQQYSQDELTAKKETLKQIQTAAKTNIDALNALEKEHHDKAIALDKELADFKKASIADLREIQRAGMSDAEASADKSLEIEQKTAQVKDLLAKQEYAKATELGKELASLAKQQAISQVNAAPQSDKYATAMVAEYDYAQTVNLTTQALEKQKAEQVVKADEAKTQADLQRVAYENVGKQIEALNTTLTTGKELHVVVDTSQVDVLKQKLDEIPPEKIIKVTFDESGNKIGYSDGLLNKAKQFAFGDVPPAIFQTPKPQVPGIPTPQIAQSLQNIPAAQAAGQTQNEKILGVYKVQMETPQGVATLTGSKTDIDIFLASQRGAKQLGRTTRSNL